MCGCKSQMSNFTYHCHTTNSDGKNTPLEMMIRAKELGFKSIGISDHFSFHPHNDDHSPWDMSTKDKAIDYWLRCYDEVKQAAALVDLKVLFGFEVDFYKSAQWRRDFEKIIARCPYDYLISSTHYLRNADESERISLFFTDPNENYSDELLDSYWDTTAAAVQSGYFDFLGHMDLFEHRGIAQKAYTNEKAHVFELMQKYHVATELNTGGKRHGALFYPSETFLKEMKSYDIPLMINDDAHSITQMGNCFDEAEKLLAKIGYKRRIDLAQK